MAGIWETCPCPWCQASPLSQRPVLDIPSAHQHQVLAQGELYTLCRNRMTPKEDKGAAPSSLCPAALPPSLPPVRVLSQHALSILGLPLVLFADLHLAVSKGQLHIRIVS